MMFYSPLVLLSVFGFFVANADPDKKLLAEGLKHAAECAANNGIKFDVCVEMEQDGANLSDPKYNDCKCWISCVAKKMKTMTEDGKWDMDAVMKIVSNLQNPALKSEAERVLPLCKDSGKGMNCEPGFNTFVCVMEKSEKAKSYVVKLLKAMAGH